MNSTLNNPINPSGFISQNTTCKFTLRAAKIEMLIADAINHHSIINDKVEALKKCVEYYSGQSNVLGMKISPNFDTYTALLRLFPVLCKFISKCLNDKLEPLRIAAIRILEFLIEQLGCSIGTYLPQILKFILLTYPSQSFVVPHSSRGPNINSNVLNPLDAPLNSNTIGSGNQQSKVAFSYKNENNENRLGFTSITEGNANQNMKLMIDTYNHLLENFLNVLPQASAYILHTIFHEILLPNIFLPDLIQELKIYFLRITEKIISLCQGDLTVNNSFYANMINMLDSSSPQIKIAVQKLWDTIKQKIIPNLDSKNMNKFIEWIIESLYILIENDNTSPQILTNFQYFLELVTIICNREKLSDNDIKAMYLCSDLNIENDRHNNNNEAINNNSATLAMKKYIFKRNSIMRDPINIKSLLKPLIVWLEHIVNNKNSKIDVFKSIWIVLNDILNFIPLRHQDVTSNDIALPLLWKVCKFCESSSPSVQMLNFLLIVLSSIKVIFIID